MTFRSVALVCAMVLAAATAAVAQQNVLTVATTETRPTVDGVVAAGEYAAPLAVGKTTLSVSRTADALTIAVTAETTGWVAVGLGSARMNGATIFIGYVKEGKLELKPQIGRGHGHADTPFDGLLASAGKEENRRTTIEIALKPSAFLGAGTKEVPLIVAYGSADSFVSMHAARWSGAIRLAD